MKNSTEMTKRSQQLMALVFMCGAGLTSYALKLAGFLVLGGIDISSSAQAIYERNFPNSNFVLDSLRNMNVAKICKAFKIKIGQLALIQISNPCTETSKSGQQKVFSIVNELYFVAAKLALELKPKTIVFENVDSLTNANLSVLYGMFMEMLRTKGNAYNIYVRILNAHMYGDPQSRPRIFIVLTEKSLGDFEWPEVVEESARKVIADVIPTANYLKNENFGENIYSAQEASPTITGSPAIFIHEDGGQRPITARELAGLMGLGEDFQLVGSLTDQKLALGNGVCVGVMSAIGTSIKNLLEQSNTKK